MKRALMTVAMMALAACASRQHGSPQSVPASTAAVAPQEMSAHGVAGWVGQEFAGRTTANGEIFDPMLMTAAHRTLPFGTLVDVHNPKTGQTVRVRVNDRGPYVGDRLIDLSYAAAQQIGLADGGGGDVDINVVKVGRGDREPPAAFSVNVPDNTSVAAVPPAAATTPAPVPAPTPAPAESQAPPVPATVESVQVTEQHTSGTETRREVAANGTTIVEVPVTSTPLPAPVPAPAPVTPTKRTTPATSTPAPAASRPQSATTRTGRYQVQVGAFSQEANAKALQKKLKAIGQDAMIEHTSLYLVRIGPFETREQAVSVRAKLEAAGISAIIITQ